MYRNHEGEIIVGAEGAEHDALLTKLAKARDEIFGYDRMVETHMINGPEYVVDEMVSEIKRLRKALEYYADEQSYEYEVLSIEDDGTENCEEPLVVRENGKLAREALK